MAPITASVAPVPVMMMMAVVSAPVAAESVFPTTVMAVVGASVQERSEKEHPASVGVRVETVAGVDLRPGVLNIWRAVWAREETVARLDLRPAALSIWRAVLRPPLRRSST